MIRFPVTVESAVEGPGMFRAGGTDLQALRAIGRHRGDVADLRDLPGFSDIETLPDGSLRLGARLRLSQLAEDSRIRGGYPGLAAAAGGLATPAIRKVATVAGNLLQEVRCTYYRHPEYSCLHSGGASCQARGGDHLHHSCYDLGPCISPHPSTLAVAFLAWGARVEVAGSASPSWSLADLHGDGTDPTRTHRLGPNHLLTGVILPPPQPTETSAWFRVSSRVRAEWPLVEAVVRLRMEGETIRDAGLALGGVAPIPLRLPAVDAALVGQPATEATFAEAARLAVAAARPLPMTGYKLKLVDGCIQEVLALAVKRSNG